MPRRAFTSLLLVFALLLATAPPAGTALSQGSIPSAQLRGDAAVGLIPLPQLDTPTAKHFRQGDTHIVRIYPDLPAAAAADAAHRSDGAPGATTIAEDPQAPSGFRYRTGTDHYTAWLPPAAGGSVRVEKGRYWVEYGMGEGGELARTPQPAEAAPSESAPPESAPQDLPIAASPPATDPAAPAAPELQGQRAIYRDAARGLRIEYEVEPTRLKEAIVLETPRPAFEWRVPLTLAPELTAVEQDGEIHIWRRDFPGLPLFVLEAAWAHDAKGVRTTVAQKLLEVDGGFVVHLALDPQWLQNERVAWPVTIDPTVRPDTGDSAYGTIALRYPDMLAPPGYGWPSVYRTISWEGEVDEFRSLLRLDLSTLSRQRLGRIVNATLHLQANENVGSESAFAVYAVDRAWTARGVTWRHADRYAGTPWTTPGGDASDTLATISLGPWGNTTTPVDITDRVRNWVLGDVPNHGFLYACASTYCSGHFNTWLEVTYEVDNTPPTAAVTAPAAGTAVSGPITITASAADTYGIREVELLVDGAVAATTTAAPYSFTLDPAPYPSGQHTLAVRAWDTANNPATSSLVAVTFATGLPAVTTPSTGPDPDPPQPAVNNYRDVPAPELGLDRRWGYAPLPLPGAYLHLKSGNLVLTATDSVLPAPGLVPVFRRSYNARDGQAHPFGPKWAANTDQRLTVADAAVTWHRADGSAVPFTRSAAGYQAESGIYETLSPTADGGWNLVRKDGIVSHFSRDGGLQWLEDRNGNRITYSYDANGRLTGVTDGVGRTATLTYDGTNRIATVTDGAGRTFTYGYDAAGRLARVAGPEAFSFHYGYHAATGLLTAVTDPTDRRWHLDYDPTGRLTGVRAPDGAWTRLAYTPAGVEVTSPLNAVTRYAHGPAGELQAITDPLGRQTAFTYDAQFNVRTVTDAAGAATTIDYDGRGNPTTVTDAQGHATVTQWNALNLPETSTDALAGVTRLAYDEQGNLLQVTDPALAVTEHTYNARGQRTATRNPLGHTTQFEYDPGLGHLVGVTDPLGQVTRHQYDPNGLPIRTTDARGIVTAYEYDDLGRLHRIRHGDPLGESEFWQTDAAGRLVRHIDPTGGVTTYAYEAAGRPATITGPLGRATQATYDGDGRLTAVTDALGNTTRHAYNAAGQLEAVTDPLGNTRRAVYDAAGRQSAVQDPTGAAVTLRYDALSRITAITDPTGATTTYGYDVLGRIQTITDALNHATTYAYDPVGRLTQVTDALNGVTRYAYDPAGQLTAITDARQNTTAFAYDAAGRRTQETRPGAVAATYAYDAAGNRIARTDFNGRSTTYTYDGRGRLTAVHYPRDGTVTFDYDAAGRRTRMVDSLGEHSWQYDGAGQLLRARDWMGLTLDYAYDAAGRRIQAGAQTYTYDAAGRMTQAPGVEYRYDARGLVQEKLFQSGVRQHFAYNAASQLTELHATQRWGAEIRDGFGLNIHLQFQRDALGQITAVQQGHPTQGWAQQAAYTYDALGRLTHAEWATGQPQTYTYDAVGNRTSDRNTDFVYDAHNRLVQERDKAGRPLAQYAYDPNGNLVEKCRDMGNGTCWYVQHRYQYNDENRLTYDSGEGVPSCCEDALPISFPNEVHHRYDADGHRVHTDGDFGTYTQYDGDLAMADFRQRDGRRLATYYRGRGGEAVAVRNENGGIHEYLLDERGSTGWLITNPRLTEGECSIGCDTPPSVVSTYRYDPWGQDAGSGHGPAYNPLRYTGARFDPASDFYLMGARYYVPQVGRFLTQDTWRGNAWEPWTQHLYAYTGNNPVNYVDPTGHVRVCGEEVGCGSSGKWITVRIRTFIPNSEEAFLNQTYQGDGREFCYDCGTARSDQTVQINLLTGSVNSTKEVGTTHNLTTGVTARAPGNTITASVSRANGGWVLGLHGNEGNPASPGPQALTPGVTYDIYVAVMDDGSVYVIGSHDKFPAYEVYVKKPGQDPVRVHEYDPRADGSSPLSLFPVTPGQDVGPIIY